MQPGRTKLIKRRGGTAIRTRVGHAIIKPLMKKYNAIFGGEHSGHFYFRDNWFADSGLIALLVCLELLSKSDKELGEILHRIDPYRPVSEKSTAGCQIAPRKSMKSRQYSPTGKPIGSTA